MKKQIQLIENFTKIRFKDFGTLYLSQGEQESLEVEADEQMFEELTAEVNDGTLLLGVKDDWIDRIGKAISAFLSGEQRKVYYHLTVKELEQVHISGNCKLVCESLLSDDLALKVSGLGDLTFDQLDCNTLDVRISGRGEFSAAGRADEQHVRISGSGEYMAGELASQSLQIVISGQGNATVRVAESLDITISGMGQVNYYGRPKLRQVISGLGKSKRLNGK
jgi:hypothetical protein